MLHTRRATSAYQLAVRPGSEGEFMGACCSLIRIVGDEEPGLFSGLVGSRAWLDKALRRMDQGPEGAAVVAVRLARMGPGAIHYLMGATSNKKLDELLKIARGVWLCDVTTTLTEDAADIDPKLGLWAKRRAAEIRDTTRQVGWSTPADGSAIGSVKEPKGKGAETGSEDNDQVALARSIGRALNLLIDPMDSVESASPALISRDGSVVRKVFNLKPIFEKENRKWLTDSIRDIVVNHAKRNTVFPRRLVKGFDNLLTVTLDGMRATVTIQVAGKPPPPPPPPPPSYDESKQQEAARAVGYAIDYFVDVGRSPYTTEPATITPNGYTVTKRYTVSATARNVPPTPKTATAEAKAIRAMVEGMAFSTRTLERTVKVEAGRVVIRIFLARV